MFLSQLSFCKTMYFLYIVLITIVSRAFVLCADCMRRQVFTQKRLRCSSMAKARGNCTQKAVNQMDMLHRHTMQSSQFWHQFWHQFYDSDYIITIFAMLSLLLTIPFFIFSKWGTTILFSFYSSGEVGNWTSNNIKQIWILMCQHLCSSFVMSACFHATSVPHKWQVFGGQQTK